MKDSSSPATTLRSAWVRLLGYLKARPILVLLFFTPGLIEYVSGDTSLALLVFSPPIFLFELLMNVGIYGPGVLLIREASIRWNKGWASILLMGLAYGIVNEGLAAGTLFNANSVPVISAGLGAYGRYLGVNWVWAVQIAIIHSLFSISLPVLLLGLTLPATRGRRLLSKRGVLVTAVIGAADVGLSIFLDYRVVNFFAGLPLLLGAVGVIAALVFLAFSVPRDLLTPRRPFPSARPVTFVAVGLLYFLSAELAWQLPVRLSLPPFVAITLMLAVGGGWLVWVLYTVGQSKNEAQQVALATGCYAPILIFGTLGQISFPLVVVGDLAFLALLAILWRTYAPMDGTPLSWDGAARI